jgi:hypothetical protein
MREEEQRQKQEEEQRQKQEKRLGRKIVRVIKKKSPTNMQQLKNISQEELRLIDEGKKKVSNGSTTTTSFSFSPASAAGNMNNGFSFGNSSTSVTPSSQNNGPTFGRTEKQRSTMATNASPPLLTEAPLDSPPSNTFQHRNVSILRVQAAVHDYLINTLEEQITNAFITKHPELPDQVSTLRDASEEMLNEELMALTYDVVNK